MLRRPNKRQTDKNAARNFTDVVATWEPPEKADVQTAFRGLLAPEKTCLRATTGAALCADGDNRPVQMKLFCFFVVFMRFIKLPKWK